MNRTSLLVAAGTVVLATTTGCSFPRLGPSTTTTPVSSSSSSIEQAIPLTYEGRLEKADVTASQGTHRLSMGVGLYLALESSALKLDDYLGEEVKVTGYVRPTLNGKDKIMEVSQIISVLENLAGSGSAPSFSSLSSASSSSSSSSISSVILSSSVSSFSSSRPALPASSSSSSRSPIVSSTSSLPPPPLSSSSSSEPLPAVPGQVSESVMAIAKTMAKMNLAPESWTQKYCTSYVGFCFPMHKNWFFKSFGAKTASLWHVELSSQEIENVGDAPLVINFVSGSLPLGVADSSLVVGEEIVTGFREWTGKRHFEVSAPLILRNAVEYITNQLATYEPPMSP